MLDAPPVALTVALAYLFHACIPNRAMVRCIASLFYALSAFAVSDCGVDVKYGNAMAIAMITGLTYETLFWNLDRMHAIHHLVTIALTSIGSVGWCVGIFSTQLTRVSFVGNWVR